MRTPPKRELYLGSFVCDHATEAAASEPATAFPNSRRVSMTFLQTGSGRARNACQETGAIGVVLNTVQDSRLRNCRHLVIPERVGVGCPEDCRIRPGERDHELFAGGRQLVRLGQ